MGRRNGKLKNFLKEALESQKYINLFYDPMKPNVFELYLPRYKKPMDAKYEIILKDWFELNNRKYKNYSNGKTVLQVAMRKSLFIISLKPICKRLLFRFGTPEESEEKKKQQKEKLDFKEKMPSSVASSGHDSGHESSPEPFKTNDQVEDDGDYDNDIDALFSSKAGCILLNDGIMEIINNSPDENMEMKTDIKFSDQVNVPESDNGECNSATYDIDEMFDAYDVSLQQDCLPVLFPQHSDQISSKAGSNFETPENLEELEVFCKNIIDGSKDVLDLPELNKSGNKTSDQSVCAGLNQPKIARDDNEIPAISLVQIPETQSVWMCTAKIYIGSLIQYICEPMISLTKADPAYKLVSIKENSKHTSHVFIGSTFWEPGRTIRQYMVLSDRKFLLIIYE